MPSVLSGIVSVMLDLAVQATRVRLLDGMKPAVRPGMDILNTSAATVCCHFYSTMSDLILTPFL